MSNAGRPKKPTAVKKLEGTFRHDREKLNEMMPAKLEYAPSPPDFLDERAAVEWIAVCKDLLALGMLHRVDLALLSAYCQEMAVYVKASENLMRGGYTIEFMKEDGSTYSQPSPWNSIKNQALKNAQGIANQFGFTPSSRAKINLGSHDQGDGFNDVM